MAEWLKAHAWKACKQETVSGVRIPSSPQLKSVPPCNLKDYRGFLILFNVVPKSTIYKGFLLYVIRFVVVLERIFFYLSDK